MENSEDKYHGQHPQRVENVPSTKHPASSPASGFTSSQDMSKPKKRSSLTPNTFRRFFTPRSAKRSPRIISRSRQALLDITRQAKNMATSSDPVNFADLPPLPDPDENELVEEHAEEDDGSSKRRKLDHSSASEYSTTDSYWDGLADENTPFVSRRHNETFIEKAPMARMIPLELPEAVKLNPASTIRRGREAQAGSRLLQRELGLLGRRRMTYCSAASSETARFFSGPTDYHEPELDGIDNHVAPFCVAACNTNPLVAVGDQLGGVRLLETGQHSADQFSGAYVTFRPHQNAVIDMTFSSDDLLLATASGDQSARIVDMPTQRELCRLTSHTCSIKQIRFQPGLGGNKVVATASRDGDVKIWDLRCTPKQAPSRPLIRFGGPDGEALTSAFAQTNFHLPRVRIARAHAHNPHLANYLGLAWSSPSQSVREDPRRKVMVSVTSLEFLPAGREHLFVTASEADARIKLWDIRAPYHPRRGHAVPLSTVPQPEGHDRHRSYGVTSLALSSDSARLYSLCCDHTVYAYSTNHLILGHGPALSTHTHGSPDKPVGAFRQQGLGPLYSFRHPRLKVGSFYVKLSLRKANNDQGELLAIGSSDCALLIPTDQSLLHPSMILPPKVPSSSPSSAQKNYRTFEKPKEIKDVPTYYGHGTPLIEGHGDSEVSAVAWTVEGNLVTIGDDRRARCWRTEKPTSNPSVLTAEDLRRLGKDDGQTWEYGWADPDEDESE